MKRGIFFGIFLLLLIPPAPAADAKAAAANKTNAIKAGANCTKLKSTAVSAGIKYTCIKSGSKFVWNKGVRVPTPKPSIETKNCNTKSSNARIYYDWVGDGEYGADPVLSVENLSDCNLGVSISATGVCKWSMHLMIPLQLQYNLRPREILRVNKYALGEFFPFADMQCNNLSRPEGKSTYAAFAPEYSPTIFITSSY